jgi:hypothetical protein
VQGVFGWKRKDGRRLGPRKEQVACEKERWGGSGGGWCLDYYYTAYEFTILFGP